MVEQKPNDFELNLNIDTNFSKEKGRWIFSKEGIRAKRILNSIEKLSGQRDFIPQKAHWLQNFNCSGPGWVSQETREVQLYRPFPEKTGETKGLVTRGPRIYNRDSIAHLDPAIFQDNLHGSRILRKTAGHNSHF